MSKAKSVLSRLGQIEEAKKGSTSYEVVQELSKEMVKETGDRKAWGWDPYHSINADGDDVKGIRIGFNDDRKKYVPTLMSLLNGIISDYKGTPGFVRAPLNDELIKFPDGSKIKVMVSHVGTISIESR